MIHVFVKGGSQESLVAAHEHGVKATFLKQATVPGVSVIECESFYDAKVAKWFGETPVGSALYPVGSCLYFEYPHLKEDQ